MDKYQAAYYLHKEPVNTTLKVFQSFSADVTYHIAMLESEFSKKLMDEDACFKKEMKRLDVDDLLMEYLDPVSVSEK